MDENVCVTHESQKPSALTANQSINIGKVSEDLNS